MASSQLKAASTLARGLRVSRRAFTASARQLESAKPAATPAPVEESQPLEINQAPNRLGIWSRSQRPRSTAMTGPRFEQTDFDVQVRQDSVNCVYGRTDSLMLATAST